MSAYENFVFDLNTVPVVLSPFPIIYYHAKA